MTAPSLRRAINETCHQCIASDHKRRYYKLVESCSCYTCPLFTVRPVPSGNGYTPAYKRPDTLVGWDNKETLALSHLIPVVNDGE